jgi:hypothetical protein
MDCSWVYTLPARQPAPPSWPFHRAGRDQREERPREEMPREYLYLSEGGPLCTEQAASTVDYVLRSDAVQNICTVLTGLLCTQRTTFT